MFRSCRKLVATTAVLIPLGAVHHSLSYSSGREKDLEDKIFDVAGRLRAGLSQENLMVGKTHRNGVDVYYPRLSKFPRGLPICRIVTAQIKAPVDEISGMWLNQDSRKSWDSSVTECQVVSELDNDTCVAYFEGRPGYVVPARDFAQAICRVPAGVVGINDFVSTAFVNVDASDSTPKGASWAVRGNMNSILVLKPVNAETTQVTYVVEIRPNGWLFNYFVDYFANCLADPIVNLKKELEQDLLNEDANASVEEIARQRFKRHQAQQEQKHHTSIVKDVNADIDDLKKTLEILESRLEDIRKSQKADGLDLSSLEKRVKSDIARLKQRISKGS